MPDKSADRDLMLRFQRRQDQRAFEALVERWDRRVLSFLAKASGDAEAAKDMRQEVFIRLYRYGHTYKPDHAFTTWLFQIASNVLSTWRKKQSRRALQLWDFHRETGDSAMSDPAPGPRESAALNETASDIQQAIDRFTPTERELILLRLDLELSYPEIGRILDIPETTAKSRFYALVKRLRAFLEETGTRGHSERSMCT